MITKEEREKDKAIAGRVTKPLPWTYSTSNSHRWFLSDGRGAVAYGTKLRDGADDIVIDDRDGQHLENSANRLPAYIADAEEMEQRIAKIETLAPLRSGTVRDEGATLDMVLRILRGEL